MNSEKRNEEERKFLIIFVQKNGIFFELCATKYKLKIFENLSHIALGSLKY
jgi:hypothetical protein